MCGFDRQYLNTNHHVGIIYKEKFKAVQMEMTAHSIMEVGEDKIRKYMEVLS